MQNIIVKDRENQAPPTETSAELSHTRRDKKEETNYNCRDFLLQLYHFVLRRAVK